MKAFAFGLLLLAACGSNPAGPPGEAVEISVVGNGTKVVHIGDTIDARTMIVARDANGLQTDQGLWFDQPLGFHTDGDGRYWAGTGDAGINGLGVRLASCTFSDDFCKNDPKRTAALVLRWSKEGPWTSP